MTKEEEVEAKEWKKERARAYARDYYAQNREKCIKNIMDRRALNPERAKETTREWKRNNRERCNEINVRWKKNHPLDRKVDSWRYIDENVQKIRDYSNDYKVKRLAMVKIASKKYRDRLDMKERQKILRASLELLKDGTIIMIPCRCGCNEGLKMFHNDYLDPMNIEFMCKECFWLKTKERNRQLKLDRLEAGRREEAGRNYLLDSFMLEGIENA